MAFSCSINELEKDENEISNTKEGYSATPYYYYYDGVKQYFELDTKYAFVSVADENSTHVFNSNNAQYESFRIDIPEGRR